MRLIVKLNTDRTFIFLSLTGITVEIRLSFPVVINIYLYANVLFKFKKKREIFYCNITLILPKSPFLMLPEY